jgi:hypothetical protein
MPAIRKAEAVEAQLKEVIAEKNKQQAIMRHEASEIKAETGRLKAEIVRASLGHHTAPSATSRGLGAGRA